jgi:hypothetical protein
MTFCVGVTEDPNSKTLVNNWVIDTKEHNPALKGYACMVFLSGYMYFERQTALLKLYAPLHKAFFFQPDRMCNLHISYLVQTMERGVKQQV